jgi:ribosomal protein L37AE/L43A
MERIEPTARTGNVVSCPLCGHPDTHYLKETGTWVCNHCAYTWYTIERCSIQRPPGT